jgi:thiol-disulfide isomerase/thioredoxin
MPKTLARLATAALVACLAATAAPPAGRSAKQIQADLAQVDQQIEQTYFPTSAKYNPLYRQQMLGVYGPLYRQRQALCAEYATAVPKAAVGMRHESLIDDARLAFWGDADAKGRLDAATADADPQTSLDGKLGTAVSAWWSAGDDAAAQAKIADGVEELMTAHPTSGAVADAIHLMLGTTPASVALGQRLTTDLTVKMAKTPQAKTYAAVPNKLDEPLAIDGTLLTGKSFKSSAWAGKVVLIDFWATWCPPCREEIPHVAKVYQQYHDQGFEVIGVSSDQDRHALTAFLKDHPEMPWPELCAGGSGWHPLTKKFHIFSIPTMYLIDRNGVLRTVEAREAMDKMVPELLAEAYTPPAKSTPPANGGPKPAAPAPAAAAAGNVPADLRLHQAMNAGSN